ncbi:tetratricopeptide repeat protein [Kitasatospora misakiensis]|uniref:Tetratricopeptide repeat protein n=1 Tax=Kitasatospora misakiensis TaxID=67330 RepID=A0ABW0XF48_9ACTN
MEKLGGECVQDALGRLTVLHGMGGIGKTAVALSLARKLRGKGVRVFWISAASQFGLREAMLQITIRLGAAESLVREAALGHVNVADVMWEALEGSEVPWLLVFDSADDPGGIENELGPAWLSSSPSGSVLVTSRQGSRGFWPCGVNMMKLDPLSPTAGMDMLLDLAGARGAVAQQCQQAELLAARLGGIPLALRLAGCYLSLPSSGIRSFEDYRAALDRDFKAVIDRAASTSPDLWPEGQLRSLIMQTWEISLDTLEKQGIPQARTVMRLLSCWASQPFPIKLLSAKILARTSGPRFGYWDELVLERTLNALNSLGLVDVVYEGPEWSTSPGGGFYQQDGPPAGHHCIVVHPLVAEVNEAQLDHSEESSQVWAAAVRCLGIVRGMWTEDPGQLGFWQLIIPHLLSVTHRLPDECADLFKVIVDVQEWFGQYLRVSGQYEIGYKLASVSHSRISGLRLPDELRFLSGYICADWSWQTSRLEEADELVHEACHLAGKTAGPESYQALVANGLLVAIQVERGFFKEAEKLARRFAFALEGGQLHQLSAQAYHHLATILRETGKLEEAEENSRLAVRLCETIPGFPSYTKAVIRHELGVILWHRGRLDDALGMLAKVHQSQREFLAPWHPSILVTRYDIASINAIQGNLMRALMDFMAIYLTEKDFLGERHYATLQAKHQVAQVMVQLGELEAAEMILDEIELERRSGKLETRHMDVLATRHELVHIKAQRGNHIEASQEWREILEEERRELGMEHPSTLRTHFNWAICWAALDRQAIARVEMGKVLMARRRTLGDKHYETQQARQALESLIRSPRAIWRFDGQARHSFPRSRTSG